MAVRRSGCRGVASFTRAIGWLCAGWVLAAAAHAQSPAQGLERADVAVDGEPVPVEVARPAGPGPFPPLLYIHARRGFQDEDRRHMRELAAQGFLVAAPDWQARQMLARWPLAHDPDTERDVAAALAALRARPDVCRIPVGIVGISRGPYYAIRLAAAQPEAVGAIVAYYGHFQDPNAPEPQQLYSIAPELGQIRAPVLMLIGDADFELRRINGGRAFYALWDRGVPVELQMYPLARRGFDFRADQTPEEASATRHARERAREFLARHMRLGAGQRCPG